MAETENETKQQNGENGEQGAWRKFSGLVFLACLLSLGSMIWTTYSLLDFYQVGGFDLANTNWRDISVIGLSAAATADIAWSLTILAEYRGVRILVSGWGKERKDKKYNILPLIGWIEVLFVTFLLIKHGQSMGNGTAAFAGALPILTKLSWMVALADLKDPAALTPDELEEIARDLREARRLKEQSRVAGERHEVELEAKRRADAALLESKRAQGEMKKLEQQTEFELEKMRLTGDTELKAMQYQLKARLNMDLIRSRQQVQELQDEFEFGMAIRRRPQTIVGHAVPQAVRSQASALGITDGVQEGQDPASGLIDLASLGLKGAEVKQAEMALHYYTVDAQLGGIVTKKAFCAEHKINPPRLSEATTNFPPEWFMEHGLATWVTAQG